MNEMPSRSEMFDRQARFPFTWLSEAIGLLRSAYVLWSQFLDKHHESKTLQQEDNPVDSVDMATDRFVSSYMLLAGYAIENAIKGLIVAGWEGSNMLQAVPKVLRTHDLTELADTAQVGLSPDQEIVLQTLQEVVVWKGRYGSPVAATHLDRTWAFFDYGKPFFHPKKVRDLLWHIARHYPRDVWTYPALLHEAFPATMEEWMVLVDEECPGGTWPE